MNDKELIYFCYLIQSQKMDENFFYSIYIDEEKLRFALDILDQIIKATPSYKEYNFAAKIKMCCEVCLKELIRTTS